MKSKTPANEPELSRPLGVDKVPSAGIEETIVASPDERKKLAERFGLLELPKLDAVLTVKPARGGRMFEVEGHMTADVVQQCVVTLESLPAHIEEDIKVLYGSAEMLDPGVNPPHSDTEEEETEAIVHGIIDLGELVAQNLGVSLDPYPRKPGLEYVEAQYGDGEKGTPNPFAKLAALTKTEKAKK